MNTKHYSVFIGSGLQIDLGFYVEVEPVALVLINHRAQTGKAPWELKLVFENDRYNNRTEEKTYATINLHHLTTEPETERNVSVYSAAPCILDTNCLLTPRRRFPTNKDRLRFHSGQFLDLDNGRKSTQSPWLYRKVENTGRLELM